MPTNHLAAGTGNWYVRGHFGADTVWSVFQCSRRLVDDHQHNDAGNFVLTRGADDVVVDPSPYGTVSTLASNAPAVDSGSLPSGYSPSQGYWGKATKLAWARQSGSGVAAARCDYADQFSSDAVPSDVSSAVRDFVLVPDGDAGEVVLIDRVVTGDAGRGLHLRVRTPGAFSLASNRATATVGDSSVAVERVWSSSGTPTVRTMPSNTECESSDHRCDYSRLPEGTEYRLDVSGPTAMAIHVIAARGGNAPAEHAPFAGDGYRGVVIPRGGSPVAVVTTDTPSGQPPSTLSYAALAGALHVVVGAPVGSDGRSDVSAIQEGPNCRVQVTPHAGAAGGYEGSPLIVRLSSSCAVEDDGAQGTATLTPSGSDGQGGSSGAVNSGSGGGSPSGSASTPGEGSGATGGTATGGTGSTAMAGAAGRTRGWWHKAVRPQDETGSGEADFDTDVSTSAGSGCSVSSLPSSGPGWTLASALLGALLLTQQRRRRAGRR
jgi:hypothetical protein